MPVRMLPPVPEASWPAHLRPIGLKRPTRGPTRGTPWQERRRRYLEAKDAGVMVDSPGPRPRVFPKGRVVHRAAVLPWRERRRLYLLRKRQARWKGTHGEETAAR